jgi:FAD/FMN-containing dehydrogenase
MITQIKSFSPEFEEYLRDESRRSGSAEQLIFAKTEDDVRSALQTGVAVTVQGARTGIAAGAVPEGGLILNLSRMNAIGDVENDRITVQPGALLSEVRKKVEADGLSFLLTTENGRELSGALPELNMPDVKSSAGYYIKPDMDLIDLVIEMEGTLGLIIEAELKLIPAPSFLQALCAFFPNEDAALQFFRFLRENLKPVAIEFFGHIGDNHVHVNILPPNMDQPAKGKELYLTGAEQVVVLGCSVSAEHGIGKLKVPMLGKMAGPEGIAAMRAVKKLFDPAGILNPGNLFAASPLK